jgi:hypothetical protein
MLICGTTPLRSISTKHPKTGMEPLSSTILLNQTPPKGVLMLGASKAFDPASLYVELGGGAAEATGISVGIAGLRRHEEEEETDRRGPHVSDEEEGSAARRRVSMENA